MAITYTTPERNWMLPYSATTGIFATLTIALRLYSRIPGQLGLDDVFIVLGWALSTADIVLTNIETTKWGYNKHAWDVEPTLWAGGLRNAYWIAFLSLWSTSCIKISILLFYRRLVYGVYNRSLKWTLWAAIGFVVTFTITYAAWQLSQCTPIHAVWRTLDPTYDEPHRCIDSHTVAVASTVLSSISVLTDFIAVTLPAILIFTKTRIRFTTNQRTALLVIFGLGYITVVCGALRTYYLHKAEDPMVIDKMWVTYNAFVAGLAEANIGIICACAPSLNRLFGRFFSGPSAPNSKYSKNPSSNDSRNARSENNMGTVVSEPHSDTTVVVEDPEEREMRFYGKSFYLDQITDTSDEVVEYSAPKAGSRFLDAPYARGNVTTMCEGPTSYGRQSPERGWPLA